MIGLGLMSGEFLSILSFSGDRLRKQLSLMA